MSYCDDCLHKEVCGEEGVGDESMTFCRDKVISCEDTISRQAVLDIQAKYAEHIGATKFWQMRDDINALSSVNPQPKTGIWMETDSADPYWYMCSECHRRLFEQEAYCPSCGAIMQESERV